MKATTPLFMAAGLLVLSLATTAQATAILDVSPGGILLGARNILVSGAYYDVVFEKGSCITLYAGCTDDAITFSNVAEANAAAQALLDQVFIDGPAGSFDSQTETIFGCVSNYNCLTRIVYKHGDPTLSPQAIAANFAGWTGFADFIWDETLPASADSNYTNVNFATFTPVPEPGTLAMVGLGLAGLATRRRKSRRMSVIRRNPAASGRTRP